MIQSSLLAFEETILQEQRKSHQVSQKEELTVKISAESLSSIKNEDARIKELRKLKKMVDDFRNLIRTSKNGREIIFAVKYIESLKTEIERLEREVSE